MPSALQGYEDELTELTTQRKACARSSRSGGRSWRRSLTPDYCGALCVPAGGVEPRSFGRRFDTMGVHVKAGP